MRHAYSRSQLREMGFDTFDYQYITQKDVGERIAYLDCKCWGQYVMFLYLTDIKGNKLFAPVYPKNDYFGCKDIPIGAIVKLQITCKPDKKRATLQSIEWIRDEKFDFIAATKNTQGQNS